MDTPLSLASWRLACDDALQAVDLLLEKWRLLDMSSLKNADDRADKQRLEKLFINRILPVNAFAAVAMLNIEDAISLLLSRYVGDNVDLDGKFGGFRFELASMLDELYRYHGDAGLRRLITMPNFKRSLLSDRRVIEAFCEAIEVDEAGFRKWISKRS